MNDVDEEIKEKEEGDDIIEVEPHASEIVEVVESDFSPASVAAVPAFDDELDEDSDPHDFRSHSAVKEKAVHEAALDPDGLGVPAGFNGEYDDDDEEEEVYSEGLNDY